jgi:hypothetical protein
MEVWGTTPANVADNEAALPLLDELPEEVRYVLGRPALQRARRARRLRGGRPRAGRLPLRRLPHRDNGVEVRRVFHTVRSVAVENFNEHFKAIFGGHQQVPTGGLRPTRRFALGAVLVYQLTLLHRFEHDQDLRVGLKAYLLAA